MFDPVICTTRCRQDTPIVSGEALLELKALHTNATVSGDSAVVQGQPHRMSTSLSFATGIAQSKNKLLISIGMTREGRYYIVTVLRGTADFIVFGWLRGQSELATVEQQLQVLFLVGYFATGSSVAHRWWADGH